jgi:hypothetical protein
VYDEMLNNLTPQIDSEIIEIKQFIHLTRERRGKLETALKYMRECLNEVIICDSLVYSEEKKQQRILRF